MVVVSDVASVEPVCEVKLARLGELDILWRRRGVVLGSCYTSVESLLAGYTIYCHVPQHMSCKLFVVLHRPFTKTLENRGLYTVFPLGD